MLFKYGVDFEALDTIEDVGAICVSRPTNPTGNVVTDAEVERLGAVARARGVPLIVDNAYGLPFPGIVFGDATLAWNEDTVLCMSLSKLGLPGLRTGIVIANEEIIAALGAANAIFCLAPGSMGPALATDLVESGDVLALGRDVIRPHYAERAERALDLLRAGLDGCGVRIHRPEGAFFLWLWMPGLPIGNAELYRRLKARGVVVVSGHYFFPGLEDDDWPHKRECIRISYADDWDRVERGLAILVEEVRRACDGDGFSSHGGDTGGSSWSPDRRLARQSSGNGLRRAPMHMSLTLGVLIREARERAGLTRAELARRARMPPSAVARYETGQSSPTIDTARRCVDACGFDLRVELVDASPQRQAAADAAFARSVEDRLRTNDAFTALAAQLRNG